MKKTLIGVGIVVVIGVVLALSLFGAGPSGEKVEVERAKTMTIRQTVKASGEVEPAKQVQISTKVGGEIVDLPVKEGDMVKKGQVLCKIEQDLYKAAVDQARAALQQAQVGVLTAKAQLADADRILRLTKALYSGQHVSKNELDTAQLKDDLAKTSLQSAKHQVAQQRFALDRAAENLDQTVILAPMAGKVIRLDVEQGESVVPGTLNLPGSQLMTVADMSKLRAEVDVNEVDIPNVKLDQKVDVHVDALGDKVLKGHVEDIASSGTKDPTQGVVRFKVKIDIDEKDASLRPAMTAKVDIITAVHKDTVGVPIQAVVKRTLNAKGKEIEKKPGMDVKEVDVVYLAENGKATLKRVKTGISDELHVEITDGVKAGDPVIVGPYRTLKSLKAGTEVHFTPLKKPAAPSAQKVADSGGS